MLKKTIVLLAVLLISVPSNAATAIAAPEPTIDQTTYAVSIGASVLFGLGLGQASQGRWSSAGWPFTLIDGAFYITLISQMGDSPSGSRSTLSDGARNTIIGVYAASRVVQLLETIIWGAGHLKASEPEAVSAFVSPAGTQFSSAVAGVRFAL